MMVPGFLLCLAGFTVRVVADGVRSSAEQSAGYLAYLQEEIYTDSKDWRIAPECKGTRTHIRNSNIKNRCTLPEFLDYLWKAHPNHPDVTKPKRDWVQFPGLMTQETNLAQNFDPERWANWIFTGINLYDAPESAGHPRFVVGPLPAPGYHGRYDSMKMVGQKDYFLVLRDLGLLSNRAATEFEKQKKSLSADLKDFFTSAQTKLQTLSKTIVALRKKDKWDALWDPQKGNLAAKLGLGDLIVRRNIPQPPELQGYVRGGWQELNQVETINKLSKDKSITFAEAKSRFQALWKEVTSGDTFKEHESAINGAKKFENVMCPKRK